MLVDRNSVEVIFDNSYSMTYLIFPDYKTQKGIEFWTSDSSVTIAFLKVEEQKKTMWPVPNS